MFYSCCRARPGAQQKINNKKSVLFVIGSMNRGGAERHLLYLLPELEKHAYDCTIYMLAGKGQLADEVHKKKIKSVSFFNSVDTSRKNIIYRLFRLCISATHFIYYLSTKKPRVVHFILPEAYVFGGYCSMLFPKIKKVMSRRCMNKYQSRRPILKPLEHYLHPRMDLILGNSQTVLQQLELEGCNRQNMRLIYNFVFPVSHESAGSIDRSSLGIATDAFVICVVANLIPYKGHADLLNALSEFDKSLQTDWRCLIIGRDDGIGEQLAQQARSLEIYENCLFLGSVPDTQDYLQLSDIGVLVSHEEGFSNAVIEGMSAGLPMVVSDVGGNAEAIIDQENGFVVNAGDVKAISHAIACLASNRDRSAAMGAAARQRATTEFTLEKCVDQYVDVYNSLLGLKG